MDTRSYEERVKQVAADNIGLLYAFVRDHIQLKARAYRVDWGMLPYMLAVRCYVRKNTEHQLSTYVYNYLRWALRRPDRYRHLLCRQRYIAVETLGYGVNTRTDSALLDYDPDEHVVFENREIAYALMLRLKRLRPRWYKVVYRKVWKAMSLDEIGYRMNLSGTRIGQIYAKALDWMRRELRLAYQGAEKRAPYF